MVFKRVTGVKSPIQKKDLPVTGIDVLRVYEELQSAIKSLDIARANAESAADNASKAISAALRHTLLIKKGEDGKTPTKEQLLSLIKPLIPEPIQGEPGYTPQKGKDYTDGKTPTEDDLLRLIFPLIPKPEKGDKGDDAEVNVEEILGLLHDQLRKDKRLKPEDLEGWEQTIAPIRSAAAGFRGGGDTVAAGSNITITTNANGQKVIASTGGGSFSVIAVAGTIDDSNTSFTSASAPTLLNINGAFYQSTGGAITWTWVAGTITLSAPVGSGGSIYGIA